jgi:hypothetical protein
MIKGGDLAYAKFLAHYCHGNKENLPAIDAKCIGDIG